MRQARCRALAQIGDPAAVAGTRDRPQGHRPAHPGARRVGARRAAATAARSSRSIALVRDSDVDVRSRAIGALGELGDARAVEAITAALKDADAGVRLRAVRALADLTDGGNGPRPTTHGHARPRGWRRSLGSSAMRRTLFSSAADRGRSRRVRCRAAAACAWCSRAHRVAAGRRSRGSRPGGVQPARAGRSRRRGDPGAGRAHGRCDAAQSGRLRDQSQLGRPRRRRHDARAAGRRRARRDRIARVRSRSPARSAARSGSRAATRRGRSGALRDPRGVPLLIDALGDREAPVREQAAWALGALRDSRATAPLVARLKDEDARVREQAELGARRVARSRRCARAARRAP